MIRTVKNRMNAETFEILKQRVMQMNTGIDDFVYTEMLNHKSSYDPVTGMRKTEFQPADNNLYSVFSVTSSDQATVYCEMLTPPGSAMDSVIIYVHGAAFLRRLNDINLKTADRLCTMAGQAVCVPDYRVGMDYTYDQMINDVAACYRHILTRYGIAPERVTFLSDSSGCVTTLQMMRELAGADMPAPGKIILWSPLADGLFDDDKMAAGKQKDITLRTNNLFTIGFDTYTKMCRGKAAQDVFPLYGNYNKLNKTRILIQSGVEEVFEEDAYQLCDAFNSFASCDLELYEGMFHNFQTYFSVCEMAPVCWEHMIDFIRAERPEQKAS